MQYGKILTAISLILSLTSIKAEASSLTLIGNAPTYPGYSAKDIRISNPTAATGVYWIDPDLVGGNSPFSVFADMTSQGGGWTLGHDKANILPDLDAQSSAINILAVNQTAQIRFVSSGLDAFFTGNYNQILPGSFGGAFGWTVVSGNASLLTNLFNRPWGSIDFSQYSVYLRENNTTHYPEPVPVPATFWLFGSGLIGLLGFKRRVNKA